VSDDAAVRAMLKKVDEAFGHLDALVNNAGTTAKWKVKDLESLDMASGTAPSPSTCAAPSR
jgi:3-oxoacyl-[acyl-carrier protein] reductase